MNDETVSILMCTLRQNIIKDHKVVKFVNCSLLFFKISEWELEVAQPTVLNLVREHAGHAQ